MKFFRSLLNFYINSSLHVGLAVACLAGVSLLEFGYSLNLELMGFLFFGTIVGYNFVKYAGISNLHHLQITPNIAIIRGFTVLVLFPLGYLAFRMPVEVLFTAGLFGVCTLLYAVPFVNQQNLRSLSGLKVFIICWVWMGAAVAIPMVYHEVNLSLPIILQAIEIFAFVFVLMIPFEVRDLKYDEPNLKTIPQQFGIRKTKNLGISLLILMVVLSYFQAHENLTHGGVTLFLVSITLLALSKTTEAQSPYFASFWVEAIPILWFVILILVCMVWH